MCSVNFSHAWTCFSSSPKHVTLPTSITLLQVRQQIMLCLLYVVTSSSTDLVMQQTCHACGLSDWHKRLLNSYALTSVALANKIPIRKNM